MDNINLYMGNLFSKLTSKKQLLIFFLMLILLWRVLKSNLILIAAIVYLVWTNRDLIKQEEQIEKFDKSGTVFAGIGEPKYDLMGERYFYYPPEVHLPSSPVYSCCRY